MGILLTATILMTLFLYFVRLYTLPYAKVPKRVKFRVFVMNVILGAVTFAMGSLFV